MSRPAAAGGSAWLQSAKPVLITGGAGFIGSNLAHRLLSQGRSVTLLDNLSRPQVERNVVWLKANHGPRVELIRGDVRDRALVERAVSSAAFVFHLAAQVAVTSSVLEPWEDFDVNARGTLTVLEAIRAQDEPPPILFTSTNKVYGALEDVELRAEGLRYEPVDSHLRGFGVSELRTLDFHSPYGCSKGAADQYVLDYARSLGLTSIVFRMSCIYGPRQFGTEDQGWVAHFLLRALDKAPITIYGDGLQVRDILFIDDLVQAFWIASQSAERLSSMAFNIGGGPQRTISLQELVKHMAELMGRPAQVSYAPSRVGDQRYFVSDTRKFGQLTGWRPSVSVPEGIARLYGWLKEARQGVA